MTTERAFLAGLTLAMAGCLTALPVFGQQTPLKPVVLVIPATAGGSLDGIGRLYASNFESLFKQKFIVENRPGAGNYTGSAYVANLPPDGQTLLFSAFSAMHANLFAKDLAVDIARTLVPIGIVSQGQQFLMGSATIPPRTLKEFIAYAKKNPRKLNAGVITYTTDHLTTLRFLKAAQIDVVPIPYQSGVPGLRDLITGEIQLFVSTRNGLLTPQIQSGKIVPLAAIGSERTELLPDTPTTAEQGVSFGDAISIYAVFGPLGLNPDFISEMNKKIYTSMTSPGTREKLEAQGMLPPKAAESPAELASRFARAIRDMKDAAAEFGIKPQ